MKLIDGKLIFQTITCWECDGTKQVNRNRLCPNNWKPVKKNGRKTCEFCGAKNRHSHKTIGEYQTACTTCAPVLLNGEYGKPEGFRLENEYDNLPASIFNQLNFQVLDGKYKTNFSDSFLGIGLVGGATDYGRMNKFAKEHSHKEEIIQLIKNEYSERQAIQFVNRKTMEIAPIFAIKIGEMGYSVRPIFC